MPGDAKPVTVTRSTRKRFAKWTGLSGYFSGKKAVVPTARITMGACGSKKAHQPYDNKNSHQNSLRLQKIRSVDDRNITRRSTRDVKHVDVIKARRRESAAAIQALPKPAGPPKPEQLNKLKKRMSTLLSPERDAIKRNLSALSHEEGAG